VNPKWHFKIKTFNVKTAVKTSSGPQMNRNFISKKALTRLSVVKIVGQKHAQTLTGDRVAAATEVQGNRSRLLVPIVAHKTRFRFSQEAISLFFVEIVSDNSAMSVNC
jgi:hypothetical protein